MKPVTLSIGPDAYLRPRQGKDFLALAVGRVDEATYEALKGLKESGRPLAGETKWILYYTRIRYPRTNAIGRKRPFGLSARLSHVGR